MVNKIKIMIDKMRIANKEMRVMKETIPTSIETIKRTIEKKTMVKVTMTTNMNLKMKEKTMVKMTTMKKAKHMDFKMKKKMTTMKKAKNMNLEMKEEITMVKITKTKIRVKMEKEMKQTTTFQTWLHQMMMRNLPTLKQKKRTTRHSTHMNRGG